MDYAYDYGSKFVWSIIWSSPLHIFHAYNIKENYKYYCNTCECRLCNIFTFKW